MYKPADQSAPWSDRPIALKPKWQRILLSPVRLAVVLPELSARLSKYLVMNVAIRPTVLAALGAHGLLLLLPLWELHTPKPEALNPPEEEETTIEVQNLSDLIGDQSAEVEPLSEPAVAEPQSQQPVAAASVQPVLTEVPENLPENLPAEAPISEVAPSPNEFEQTEPPPEQPGFEMAAARGRATGRVRNFAGELVEPAPVLLSSSQRPFFFEMAQGNDISAPLKAGITDMPVYNDKTIVEMLPEIQTGFASDNVAMNEIGSYGESSLYQLIDTPSGNEVGYLSVILGGGGRTVILAFWEINPLAQ